MRDAAWRAKLQPVRIQTRERKDLVRFSLHVRVNEF